MCILLKKLMFFLLFIDNYNMSYTKMRPDFTLSGRKLYFGIKHG